MLSKEGYTKVDTVSIRKLSPTTYIVVLNKMYRHTTTFGSYGTAFPTALDMVLDGEVYNKNLQMLDHNSELPLGVSDIIIKSSKSFTCEPHKYNTK